MESRSKSTGFPIAKIPAKIIIEVKNITTIDWKILLIVKNNIFIFLKNFRNSLNLMQNDYSKK